MSSSTELASRYAKAMKSNEKQCKNMKSKVADSVTRARKSCTCYEMVFEGHRAKVAMQRYQCKDCIAKTAQQRLHNKPKIKTLFGVHAQVSYIYIHIYIYIYIERGARNAMR